MYQISINEFWKERMSNQCQSAYETICAHEIVNRCVVASNTYSRDAKMFFVSKNFDNVWILYSSVFAFGLITHVIVFWKLFAVPTMRLLIFVNDHFFELCAHALRVVLIQIFLRRLFCDGVRQFVSHEYHGDACFISALLWRDKFTIGNARKKTWRNGAHFGVTKNKQKRGRTCVPLLCRTLVVIFAKNVRRRKL